MRKILSFGIILLALVILTACGGDPTVEPTVDPTVPVDTYWDEDGNGIPDWQEEEITLTYATWQYTQPDMVTIDLLMIAENCPWFNKANIN